MQNQIYSDHHSNRIIYFDYLKILSIFLVVFVHRPWLNHSLSSNIAIVICTIAVPLFFMVNGALLFHKPLDLKKHIKKITTLFISVEMWRFLYLVASLLTHQITYSSLSKTQLWYYFLGGQNIENVPANHMWFTNTLLFLYIIFPILKTCWDYHKPTLYFFTFFIFILYEGIEEINWILSFFAPESIHLDVFRNMLTPLSSNGYFIVFFVLGAILHEKVYLSNTLSKSSSFRQYSVLSVILGFIWLFTAKCLQCHSFLWTGEAFKNGYIKIGTVLMCSGLFALYASQPFSRTYHWIAFTSKRTLDIYYIHMFLAAIALTYIYPYLANPNIFINALRSIILIIISLLIGCIVRKIPILKIILNG